LVPKLVTLNQSVLYTGSLGINVMLYFGHSSKTVVCCSK